MKSFIFVVMMALVFWAIIVYLNYPIVAINHDGECVYMIEDDIKKPCPKTLPENYVIEHVA